jgi:uncharacterized SAM-binding protein YcdF (DUF218 family)
LTTLARRFPHARLIHSGGTGDLRQVNVPESEGLKPYAEWLGIPKVRLEYEERSRNTYENAAFTKALVQPKPGERWLLVTSASHMPRSVGIFRAVDWDVIPFPVDYETFASPPWFRLNPARNLGLVEIAAHETIGLIVYYLTGHSATLFPGPEPGT